MSLRVATALSFVASAAAQDNLTAGTQPLTGSLNVTGCSAPKAAGGWGYCGPPSCKNKYITCPAEGGGVATVDGVAGTYGSAPGGGAAYSATNCQSFLPRITNPDTTDFAPRGACQTCTQKTTGVCSATFLASVIKGPGVKYAYCNDKWLTILSDGSPGIFTPNLNDVPYPPGGGTAQRTGMASLDKSRTDKIYFPLNAVELPTATGLNNIALWDSATYLQDGTGNKYGLPGDGGVGMGVNGQSIFPIYNNNARYTPAKCEVDSCQEHVGQGGGQPHWHGDPFSPDETKYRCLYGPSNYSNLNAHPPVVGFSSDGFLIYGRYLSASASGFAAPLLDACGGHKHTSPTDVDYNGFNLSATYHYHTQVFDAVCGGKDICTASEAYKASSTGPLQCWKANLSAQEGGSAVMTATRSATYKTQDQMGYGCCGMTDYYALTGVSLPTGYAADSSSCAFPAAPVNGTWAVGSVCAGNTKLLSGWQCTPVCNAGSCPSGTTRCVKGAIAESATCVYSATASTTCPGGSFPSPPSPTPSPTTTGAPTPPTTTITSTNSSLFSGSRVAAAGAASCLIFVAHAVMVMRA